MVALRALSGHTVLHQIRRADVRLSGEINLVLEVAMFLVKFDP